MGKHDRLFKIRGVTGIFFWGGKVIFPNFFPGVKCFFPVENSHFGRPKTNFRRFQKWKARKKKKKKKKKKKRKKEKKKKKKKGPHLFLERFPASISNFPPFLTNFHPFSLFSLPLFSRYVSKNFPVRSLWGALCPPPVTPLFKIMKMVVSSDEVYNYFYSPSFYHVL